MNNNSLGYILQTGASSADELKYQQLVTIDAPTRGDVIASCLGREGPYFLSEELEFGRYRHAVHVLPMPGGTTDVQYETALKQEYTWKSKKFVMPGRTTLSAAKVVISNGCVRLRVYTDGCCRYDAVVQNCAPFRLPDQMAAVEYEIELRGTATVYEVHLASSMQELTNERS